MRLRKSHDRFWPILVGSAMLLYGCMKVGPDYIRPQTSVSQNWLEVKDERVKTESAEYRAWWEAFNDPYSIASSTGPTAKTSLEDCRGAGV